VSGVATASSPTVRRRELGANLRTLRTDAGLTVEQVAEQLLCSTSKISRLETGHRGASQRDVRDLCNLYGIVDPAVRDRLMALAREGKEQAWWQSYELHSPTYVGLEDDAVSIRQYNTSEVPGLLQTPEYAHAVITAVFPRRSAEVVTQEVAARLTRQQLLTRLDAPQIQVVLDESVLRRVVGSPDVMQAQMTKLLEASSLPNVEIRVVLYGAGVLPAIENKFIILGFAPKKVSDVVFVEGMVGDLYLERLSDVRKYYEVFDVLLGMALSSGETNDFITKLWLQV
jgi:transcriptional regulator with XRE-family HTH domain